MNKKTLIILLLLSFVMCSLFADDASKQILDRGKYISSDGTIFNYIKYDSKTGPDIRFSNNNKSLSFKELKNWEAKLVKSVLSRSLKTKMKSLSNNEKLNIVIQLKDQPAYEIAETVKKKNKKKTQQKQDELMNILKSVKPNIDLSPYLEKNYLSDVDDILKQYNTSQLTQIGDIQKYLDKVKSDMNKEIRSKVKNVVSNTLKDVQSTIENLGATVYGKIISSNALSAEISLNGLKDLKDDPRVSKIYFVPKAEAELDTAAQSVFVDSFWSKGYTGKKSKVDIGLLDTGVQQDHPAFKNIKFISNIGKADSNGHGTHVAGVIISGDSTYRGLAYGLDKMLVGSSSENYVHRDADWMFSTKDHPEVINLSHGYGLIDKDDGDYTSFDAFFDALSDTHDVLITKSAGNRGYNGEKYTLTNPGSAYNILTVGGIEDQGTDTRDDDYKYLSSSIGPTIGGRKKPDVCMPAHSIDSCNNDWRDYEFTDRSGTSYAAALTAGAALLATDYTGQQNPIAVKALLINTADAMDDNGTLNNIYDDNFVEGSLWNASYGWGYVNLKKAWLHAQNVFNGKLTKSENTRFYKGKMYAYEKATLVWNRHVDYNGSSDPHLSSIKDLSDLDLTAFNAKDGLMTAKSVSWVDNVEQISVPKDQETVLRVSLYSLDEGLKSEKFALATQENFKEVSPPKLDISISVPSKLSKSKNGTIKVTVKNSGGLSAANVNAEISFTGGIKLSSGSEAVGLGTIEQKKSKTHSWKVGSEKETKKKEKKKKKKKKEETTGNMKGTIKVFVSCYAFGETFEKTVTKTIK